LQCTRRTGQIGSAHDVGMFESQPLALFIQERMVTTEPSTTMSRPLEESSAPRRTNRRCARHRAAWCAAPPPAQPARCPPAPHRRRPSCVRNVDCRFVCFQQGNTMWMSCAGFRVHSVQVSSGHPALNVPGQRQVGKQMSDMQASMAAPEARAAAADSTSWRGRWSWCWTRCH